MIEIIALLVVTMALKTKQQFAKHLGKKIRKVRTLKGISLKHFEALEHSISRHALSDIEQGKKYRTFIHCTRFH